ncbi:hypothetical protein ACOM2C_12420 [Pseudarthrobacter sp. So.54]
MPSDGLLRLSMRWLTETKYGVCPANFAASLNLAKSSGVPATTPVSVEVKTASTYLGSALFLPVLLWVTADSPAWSLVPGAVSGPAAPAAGAEDAAALGVEPPALLEAVVGAAVELLADGADPSGELLAAGAGAPAPQPANAKANIPVIPSVAEIF